MLERDIRSTLAAYVSHSRAELTRIEQVASQRATAIETPPGYILASEAQRKYEISYRRLRAWVRIGRVHVIRGRNGRGTIVYSYNEVDVARAKRENPFGRVVVWDPNPVTGIDVHARGWRHYVPARDAACDDLLQNGTVGAASSAPTASR